MGEISNIEFEIEKLKSISQNINWQHQSILKALNDCASCLFDVIGGEVCHFFLSSKIGGPVEFEFSISRKTVGNKTVQDKKIRNKVISSFLGKDKTASLGWVRLIYSEHSDASFAAFDKRRLADMSQIIGLSLKDSIDFSRESTISECNQLAMILAFVRVLEARSKWTLGHSERVANIGLTLLDAALGNEEWVISLDQEEIYNLEQWFKFAALLHDIGKVGVSDVLLDKNRKLTQEEFEKIKIHPGVGGTLMDILGLDCTKTIVPMIKHHHENYDGTGYPDHLKGNEIPPGARIIKVADVFCALSEERPYRHPLSFDDSIKMIKDQSGKMFDPVLIDIFENLPLIDSVYETLAAETHDDEDPVAEGHDAILNEVVYLRKH